MAWNIHIGKPKLPDGLKRDIVWDVTPLGKKKVSDYEGSAGPAFTVMVSLVEQGPSNVEDLSKHCSMSQNVVEFNLKKLRKAQMVRTVNAGGE